MAAEPALVLSPEAPYPLAGGGALRTASLIHYLAQTRPVDLVLFRQPGAPDPAAQLPAGLARRVSVIALPPTGRGQLARAVRNTIRMVRGVPPLVDRFSGFQDELAAALAGRTYGIGVIEHSWCAGYWEQVAPICRQTVLDLHNVESLLHERCAAIEPAGTALAHRRFRDAARAWERTWLPQFTHVLAPSAADAEAVRNVVPDARVSVYPNAIPWAPLPPHRDEEVLAFSGNLEYHPNVSAVRFFRADVWPRLRERWPNLIWRLIGKNPQAVARYTRGDPRIEVTGPVDDAIAELARARIAVVPLLAGSGTRLKILEAWAAGLPVVSTPLGAEGLPGRDGEHWLLAGDGPAFAAATDRLLQNPTLRAELGHAGRALLERDFTWQSAWKKLEI